MTVGFVYCSKRLKSVFVFVFVFVFVGKVCSWDDVPRAQHKLHPALENILQQLRDQGAG